MHPFSALTVIIALGIGSLAGCSSTPEAKTPEEAAMQLTKRFADSYLNDVELGDMFCSDKNNVEKLPEQLTKRKSDVSKIETVAPDASHTPAPGHRTFTSVLNVSGEFFAHEEPWGHRVALHDRCRRGHEGVHQRR